LLDENVFPVFQGGFPQFKMRAHGRYDRNGVDLRGREQLGRARRERHVRMSLLDALECGRALITDGRDLAAVEATQIADDVWTPITVADDTDMDHSVGLELRGERGDKLVRASTGEHRLRRAQDDLEIEPE